MKSIIKLKAEPGLWLGDSPIPTIKDNEVLIKIHKTSICGTDLTIYKWEPWAQKNVPVPLVVGHEFVGEIAEMGKNVKGFELGARVTGEGHITCGVCSNCKKAKAVDLSTKKTKCFRCNKTLSLDKLKVFYSSNSNEKIRNAIGLLNAELDGNLEKFKEILKNNKLY